jgi:hypothetical protein
MCSICSEEKKRGKKVVGCFAFHGNNRRKQHLMKRNKTEERK